MSDDLVRLAAPAKLTRSLRVVGVRPDGYHELSAEMVTLSVADQLEIDPAGEGLTIIADPWTRADGLSVGPDNLILRALRAVDRRAGVRLEKHIPVGGGLGGGSADAGAVLRWAGCTDPQVAAALGADVAFCVRGGRAMVEGIGEQLTPLEHEQRSLVLLLPPFGVDTAAVYRAWDDLAAEGGASDGPVDGGAPINDLTAAALRVEPRLAAWRDALGEATGVEPLLAGSGSTWFVEDARPSAAQLEQGTLQVGDEVGRLLATETVPEGWNGPSSAD